MVTPLREARSSHPAPTRSTAEIDWLGAVVAERRHHAHARSRTAVAGAAIRVRIGVTGSALVRSTTFSSLNIRWIRCLIRTRRIVPCGLDLPQIPLHLGTRDRRIGLRERKCRRHHHGGDGHCFDERFHGELSGVLDCAQCFLCALHEISIARARPYRPLLSMVLTSACSRRFAGVGTPSASPRRTIKPFR